MLTAPAPAPSPPRLRFAPVREFGPNWYAAVMGTAIVASGGAALPWHPRALEPLWAAVWLVALAALLAVAVARALHWMFHRDRARAGLLDPTVAPFYGCLAMAPLAVGGGALTAGAPLLGDTASVLLDAVLYTAGTVLGLLAAVGVPYVMVTRHVTDFDDVSPVWLLPVVAPMVSAALGPPLVAHLPAGGGREALLYASVAMFGLSLLTTLLLLPLLMARMLLRGAPAPSLAPTLFLVLGPLGQSTTAVTQFARAAPGVVPAPFDRGFAVFAVVYGVPVIGFALMWLVLSVALVIRARRAGMGFSMTWWAFTFPVGTCVTGSAGLADRTGFGAWGALSEGLYALLVIAWAAAAAGTLAGLVSGRLPVPRPRAAGVPLPSTVRTTSAGGRRPVRRGR